MKIQTPNIFPPISIREFDWQAIDSDTYDGAEDSVTRHQIGHGPTKELAIEDLMGILREDD